MKMDRLLGILALLMQRERVTAPYLAQRFEVSRRTIVRDIQALCQAGIPICTHQGAGGGISVAPGYKLRNSVLTWEEMEALVAGIRGIESVSGAPLSGQILCKLSPEHESGACQGDLDIDLASHYKGSLSEKIALLRRAIRSMRQVTFQYYSEKGQGRRQADPYSIVFRWSDWYLFGYCDERQDFRMFKLNRLWELEETQNPFIMRPIPPGKTPGANAFPARYSLSALFDSRAQYRLVEEYGPGSYESRPDGKLFLQAHFANWDYMIRWLLSFGDSVEILQPAAARAELLRRAERMAEIYRKPDGDGRQAQGRGLACENAAEGCGGGG